VPLPPLTSQQRWHDYELGLVGFLPFVGSAISAGLGQWRDTPHEWGQGGSAYGTRMASSFAQHAVQQTILAGTAALLAEDSRYVRSGLTGFRPRLKYALTGTVMARSRDGRRHVSWSKIGALTGAAFLSRAWQPPSSARPQSAGISMAAGLGVAAGLNVAHEFLPRLFRMGWLRLD